MNKSPFTSALIAVQVVLAVWVVWLAFSYVSAARQMRSLQLKMSFINFRQAAMSSLAKDVLEYSQKNHDIDPLLESVNLKPKNAPAARPAGR